MRNWWKTAVCPVLAFVNEGLVGNRTQIFRIGRIYRIKICVHLENLRYLRPIPVLVFVDEDGGQTAVCPVFVFVNEELGRNGRLSCVCFCG